MFEDYDDDEDYINNERIKNTIRFLKEQVYEIEKNVENKTKEYFLNKSKVLNLKNNLIKKEVELNCYISMFPNYEKLKEIRSKNNICNEIEELKEDIEYLNSSITILNKTIDTQKYNIDKEIQSIVRLNIDISWIKKD